MVLRPMRKTRQVPRFIPCLNHGKHGDGGKSTTCMARVSRLANNKRDANRLIMTRLIVKRVIVLEGNFAFLRAEVHGAGLATIKLDRTVIHFNVFLADWIDSLHVFSPLVELLL